MTARGDAAFSDEPRRERARKLHLRGALDQAEQLYRELRGECPDDPEVPRLLGLLCWQRGRTSEALELLRAAVAAAPLAPAPHVDLGRVLRASGDLDAAEASYRAALALAPTLAAVHFELGATAVARGDRAVAIERYARAAELAPDLAPAHHALGRALVAAGRDGEAIAPLRRASELEPADHAVLRSLANALYRSGQHEQAQCCFERLLVLEPGAADATHLLAALRGLRPERCPPEYVAAVFDGCAAEFDARLVQGLGYRTPKLLRALLDAHRPATRRFARALDLGCGTGLGAVAFRDRCEWLVGVDLSAAMVAQARGRGLYDELCVADLEPFVHAAPGGWDLVVAADVLPYLGELRPLLQALRERCAAGALFALSTETGSEPSWELRVSGRYAHHPGYVSDLAHDLGLRLLARRTKLLRREGAGSVAGDLFLLERLA